MSKEPNYFQYLGWVGYNSDKYNKTESEIYDTEDTSKSIIT